MILGIDVAKYQPTNPDPAAVIPNIQFYFAKATQGAHTDPTYTAHVAHAREHLIPVVGAYHFGMDYSGITQANYFLSVAANADAYALDIEGPNPMRPQYARDFINRMHFRGKKVIMYHSESGFPHYGQDLDWVANYNHASHISWDFWQYGPAAPNVDGDKYKGTTTQMLTALGLSVSKTKFIAYIRFATPYYDSGGNQLGYVPGGGTRLVVSGLVRLGKYYYYKILEGHYGGKYLHAGGKTFVVNKVPA